MCLKEATGPVSSEITCEKFKHRAERRVHNGIFALLPSLLQSCISIDNMYGITETTVHVTYRPINRADLNSVMGSVIGKPIPDLRVYLRCREFPSSCE